MVISIDERSVANFQCHSIVPLWPRVSHLVGVLIYILTSGSCLVHSGTGTRSSPFSPGGGDVSCGRIVDPLLYDPGM